MIEEAGYEYLSKEDKLLSRIRSRFEYAKEYWKDIYEDGKDDTKFVALEQWDTRERDARKEAVRPCLVMDEINQNLNQVINSIRQNKRAIKVVPRGFGANDKTAELRGDLIREIEYKSHAQSAYITGFQSICIAGYGGWVIRRRYVSEKGFDQEIVIERIQNAESSYPDPDSKKSDFSDAKWWFLLDLIPRSEYKERFPKATIVDFDAEQYKVYSSWITEQTIQVAEYWEVTEEDRELYLVTLPQTHDGKGGGVMPMFEDELPEGFDPNGKDKESIRAQRTSQKTVVKQHITNGVEILETNDEPGKFIPIIWGTGKELYVETQAGTKRKLMSMVRGARDPQRMLNYYATAAAEMTGMMPKVPWIAAHGQLVNPENWQLSNVSPVTVLEYKPKVDGIDEILPPPQRVPLDALPIEKMEIGKESCRRSIQAALGMNPLPTNAQKINDKSGVALKQIDDEEDRGTFHFVDNFEMMLEHSGRVINDKIPYVYDGQRTIGLRNGKDDHRTQEVNTNDDPNTSLVVGEHEVTISTGPSFQSEREQANEFVKTIIPEMENIIADQPTRAKLLALLVQTQNIGPIGDEIVKLLNPEDNTQATIQNLQSQLATANQMAIGLKTENDTLYAEKKGQIVQKEYEVKMKQMDNETKLAIAEIQTKAQIDHERDSIVADIMGKLNIQMRDQIHEITMAALDQQHQKEMAANQAANASALSSQEAIQSSAAEK